MLYGTTADSGMTPENQRRTAKLESPTDWYRTLFDATPAIYLIMSPDGTVLSINQFGSEQLGYGIEELVGQSVLSLVYHEDQPLVLQHITHCFQHPEQPGHWEFRKIRKDHSLLWVRETARVIEHPKYQRVLLLVCEDITERKEVEDLLKTNEQTIRQLYAITSSRESTFEQRIRALLKLGCQRFNLPVGVLTRREDEHLEIRYLQSDDVFLQEGAQVPLHQFFCHTRVVSEEPICLERDAASTWGLHPGETSLPFVEAYLGTRVMVNNEIYGTLCFTGGNPCEEAFTKADKDLLKLMTRWIEEELEYQQTEEALRESEERYRTLVTHSKDPIFYVGTDQHIIYVSPAVKDAFGYAAWEMTKDLIPKIVHPQALHKFEHVWKYFAIHQEFSEEPLEMLWIRKNGKLLYADQSFTNVRNAEGTVIGFLTIVRDITDRKLAEMALQTSEERLRMLARRVIEIQETERRHLARELHDEIGQDLTALKLAIQKARPISDHTEQAAALEVGINIVDRTLNKTRQLALDLRPSMLDDFGLFSALKWLTNRITKIGDVVIHLEGNELARRPEPGIELACYRVAQEALTNILRHASATHTHVHIREQPHQLELIVRDDGIGFDPEASPTLHETRMSAGLIGMKERVTNAGGHFTLESAPQMGTEIRAWFPLTHHDSVVMSSQGGS